MNKWLIAILFLAAAFRLVLIGDHMGALYGDEISIGYNAYSILKTGQDEFGRFLPLQFESWGDQKNPVYIYTVVPFEIVFGLNACAVRLPSALSGILAIWLTYLLVRKLSRFFEDSPQNRNKSEQVALIAALLLAVSPWHVHISRGGYEANMALTLGLSGAYFLLAWLQDRKWKYFLLSIGAFVLSMYTYYTTKLFVPLLIMLLWSWGYWMTREKNARKFLHFAARYIILFVILCLPILYLALFSNGQARFATINIFSNPQVAKDVDVMRSPSMLSPSLTEILVNKPYVWFRDFLQYYSDNLSPSFWFVNGDSSLRYSIGNHGMLYLIEAPFFLVGFLFMFQRNRKLWILLLGWMLLAPLPTALVGKAYGLRSLALLPIPMIFSAYGFVTLNEYIKTYYSYRIVRIFSVIVAFILIGSVSNWLVRYAYIYSSYGYYWYDGMTKDAISYALQQSPRYNHVFISRYYGKTEMYYAFYTRMNPEEYRRCSQHKVTYEGEEMIQCGKYIFGDMDTKNRVIDDLHLPSNSLVIDAPDGTRGSDSILARDDQRELFKIIK